MSRAVLFASALLLLAACGEKPQALTGARQDASSYHGTGTPYASPGWKQGDRISWEQQLKTRTQQGQNEYAKTN